LLLFVKKFIPVPGNKIGHSGAYPVDLLILLIKAIMIFNHFLEHCFL